MDELSIYPSLCPSFVKTSSKKYNREMKKDFLEEQMCLEAARAEIEEEKQKIETKNRSSKKQGNWHKTIQENWS